MVGDVQLGSIIRLLGTIAHEWKIERRESTQLAKVSLEACKFIKWIGSFQEKRKARQGHKQS